MSDQSPHPMKRVIWIAVALFALSGLATLFDIQITNNRSADFVPGDFRRIVRLCEIFAHGFGIAIILYLIWAITPSKRKWLPRLAACAILPGLAVQVVKLFVVRYRPLHFETQVAERLSDTWVGVLHGGGLNFEYASQSFPSAHAATAFGLATGLIWLFPSGRHLFVVLALLASFQRVVAGAHWLSDVFAGAAIAVIVCGLIFHDRRLNGVLSRLENKESTAAGMSDSVELAQKSNMESQSADEQREPQAA